MNNKFLGHLLPVEFSLTVWYENIVNFYVASQR